MADSKLQPLLDAAAKATILPCPFCGDHYPTPRIGKRRARHLGPDRYHWYVSHGWCHSEGAHGLTEAQAIENWNRRAPSSLELRLREYVRELKADGDYCNDEPWRQKMYREFVKRLEAELERKP